MSNTNAATSNANLLSPTTAAAAAAAAKPAGNKLRRPAPSPAGPRVKRNHPFPAWNLIKVPIRVLQPPAATGMVGSVRSFSATPLSDVKLADVIANKHLSPLSLKDFEGYLVFKEHSAESLYFILWLNEYEKEYNAWRSANPQAAAAMVANKQATSTDPHAFRTASHLPSYLSESLQSGLEAFLTPDGPLELNLSQSTRDQTLVEAGQSGDPRDFAAARDAIEHSLNRSLEKHAKSSVANAGPRRLVFCFCLGLSLFLLGLVPPFVGIFGGYARGVRAAGLFFIWFGAAVMYMALHRLCGVIWLLGEDRQLLPWERSAEPLVMSSSLVSIPSSPSTDSVSGSSGWDEESSYGGENEKSPQSSFKTQTSATPYPWVKQQQQQQELPVSTLDGSSRPPSYYSKKSDTTSLVPTSAPVWGACTSTFSPDVIRHQWRTAVHSFLAGALVLVIVGVPLMAVPNA